VAASLTWRRLRSVAVGDVHTEPYGGRWANRVEGDDEVANIFDSRDHAIVAGSAMAEVSGARHVVHDVPVTDGPAGDVGS
jgi:hypothetical protein